MFGSFGVALAGQLGDACKSAAPEKVATSPRAKNLAKTRNGAVEKASHGSPESESDSVPDALNCLTKRELICLVRRREVIFDDVDLHIIQESVLGRLRDFDKWAREDKCVDE